MSWRQRLWVGLAAATSWGCGTEVDTVYVEVPPIPGPDNEPAPEPTCEAGRWVHGWSNRGSNVSSTMLFGGLDVGDDCSTGVTMYMRDPAEGWIGSNRMEVFSQAGDLAWTADVDQGTGRIGYTPLAIPGGEWWAVYHRYDPRSHHFVQRYTRDGAERYGFALGHAGLRVRPIRQGQFLVFGGLDGPFVVGGKPLFPAGEDSAFIGRVDRAGQGQWMHRLDEGSWIDVRGDRFGGAAALISAEGPVELGDQTLEAAEGVVLAVINPLGDITLERIDPALRPDNLFFDVDGRLIVAGTVNGSATLFGAEIEGTLQTGFVAVRDREGALAWSLTLPGAEEVRVAADELGHVYLLASRTDDPLVLGDLTFSEGNRVFAHLDDTGSVVATRNIDFPGAEIELAAAPRGGVLFGARYTQPFTLLGVDLEFEGKAGLFLASLPPDLQ